VVRATVFTLPDDLSFPTALAVRPVLGSPSRWIAGSENLLTLRAAEGILADDLVYNPVVVYGPAGIGKSTFIHMLSQLRTRTANDTLVTTGSDFSRTFGRATQQDALDTFRTRLRRLSVLVIDQAHDLADKTPSQQELARTIDAIVRRGGLVLAALRQSPVETPGLIPSLASRLAAGLCFQLHPPRRDTQRQLIAHFATQLRVALSPSESEHLLSLLNTSQGTVLTPALIRNAIVTVSKLASEQRSEIDQALITNAVRLQLQSNQPKPTDIVVATARYCRLPAAELRGPSRRADLVRARSLAMYLIRNLTGASLQEVGRLLGNRDHTTVMHALKKIETLSQSDPETKQALTELVNSLSGGGTP
jgi:chromosomal replication initiator protein